MNEKNNRNIEDAIGWNDDAIEINSRRHRSVSGGKALARSSGGEYPAPARPQGAAQGQRAAYPQGARPQGAAQGQRSAQPQGARPQGAAQGQRSAYPQGARPQGAAQGQRSAYPQGARPQGAAQGQRSAQPQSARPQGATQRTAQPQGARPQGATQRTAQPQGARPQGAGQRTAQPQRPAQGQRSAYPQRQQSARPPRSLPAQGERAPRDAERQQSPTVGKPVKKSRRSSGKLTVGCVIRRSLLVFGTLLLLVVAIVFAVVFVIAHGPSETARDKAVMSAMQASATKWAPGLFLSDETVDAIIENSKVVVTDVKSISDVGTGTDAPAAVTEDRWANAKEDGILLEFINGKTFKGYALFIKDPSRVTVAIKDKSFSSASRIFEIVEQYNALAAINGGEFPDNGVTTLSNPIGLTYSGGECVWDDGLPRTFMGFTKDNKLVVEEGTSRARADELGIRDAVAFQTGNTLITNDGENVTYYYADSNTGVAQRTAIGQLADGTVMFLVTDGRTAASLGATKNDIIDTFIDYGAVTAGMLDGGSSAMLWYRDWYTKYGVSEDSLDDWQKKGLVNIYKAFTNPRAIPSYFIVN